MPETAGFDQFSIALKSTYDEQMRNLDETIHNPQIEFDLKLIDSHLAKIIPDYAMEARPSDESDPNWKNYKEALHTFPWMCAVWQARTTIKIISEISDQEGMVPLGDGLIPMSDTYNAIQTRGPLPLLVSHLRIQSFPALQIKGAKDKESIREVNRQYAEANEKLIDLLSQAL